MPGKTILFSSSLCLVLAFPPFDIEFLAWISVVPLLLIVRDKKGISAFVSGFIWGISFFTGILYWISYAVKVYGSIPLFGSIIINAILIAYLSIYPGLFTLGVAFAKRRLRPLHCLFFIPSLWVSLEYIRGHAFTGFPWELIGYSQYKFLTLIQISDISGVYGASFLIILVNALIFLSISERRFKLKETVSVFLILGIVLIYGKVKINTVEKEIKKWRQLPVGIVQGNIDQDKKWNREYQLNTVKIYSRESRRLIKEGAGLLIWPETATPFYLQSNEMYYPMVLDILKGSTVRLLTGSPAYGFFNRKPRYFNSAFLLSYHGIEGRYDKIHLVPFGEYVPLKKLFFFAGRLVEGVGDFSSGERPTLLQMGKVGFGVVICYEALFPDLFRRFVKEGGRFMLNITNDAWFGRSSAPYQHFSQTVFRSVENRVFLIRAANTGISGVVSPVGDIVIETPLFKRLSFISAIGLKEIKDTFYTRHGDVFALINLLFSISVFFVIRKGKR